MPHVPNTRNQWPYKYWVPRPNCSSSSPASDSLLNLHSIHSEMSPTSNMHSFIDKFYPSDSAEAVAHAYIKEHLWHDPTITIDTIGLCASYAALSRYIIGEDLYVPPRNEAELSFILYVFQRSDSLSTLTVPHSKRYTTDVLHSLVSQARDSELRTMLPKARRVAASSLEAILRNPEHCESLLIRHSPPENDVVTLPTSQARTDSPIPQSRVIRTA
ncbi:hypothetical protein FRC08_004116 [Ceratobasidium sp. 394]|nr:hypothetical protein FRC08_004116 [Ceratobasidium sp. 394]